MAYNKILHRYVAITAAATFFLLIAGSLVTSNDAGLAVPDWPLSYGTWFPPMVGGIFYEHGHRMIAGTVGILILILAAWLALREPRIWVRRLGYAALLAVFIQALLGGLTVLLLLPPQVSISHACLGQTVFCLVVCLSLATGRYWNENPAVWQGAPAGIRQQGILVAVCAGIQLMLGAIIRHTGALAAVHIAGAATLATVAAVVAKRVHRNKPQAPMAVCRAARQLLILISLQVIAGAWVYFNRRLIPARTLHLGMGALVLAQAVVLSWYLARVIPKKS